jgi:hypothetical protein
MSRMSDLHVQLQEAIAKDTAGDPTTLDALRAEYRDLIDNDAIATIRAEQAENREDK